MYAPGAHIISELAPASAVAAMCPSCVIDGQYMRASGTSMAAPMIFGLVADLLEPRQLAIDPQRDAAAKQAGDDDPAPAAEDQAEHEREIAERERLRTAAEVQVHGRALAGREGDRKQPPRQVRPRKRRQSAHWTGVKRTPRRPG